MAVFRAYRCPDCGGIFKFLHHPSDAPPPDQCQLCHAWMRDDVPEPVFVPQAPGIRKSLIVKSMDQTYRAMESASIERAQEAADMAGVPVSEMSHLKITDLKDPSNMRAGDISAVTPPAGTGAGQNQVAHMMQQMGNNIGGGFNPLNVAGSAVPGQMLAAQAHSGDAPHAGEAIRSTVGSTHRDRAWAMQQRGQMGSYRGN